MGRRRCAIALGRGYAEALAKIEKKDPSADHAVASFSDLKKEIEKPENSSYKLQFEVQRLELQGTYALKSGDAIKGLMLLTEAAPKELALRAEYDDPPFFPTLMYSKLGYAYLSQNSPKLAADAFERALETVKNDPFALAGLSRARQALGDTKRRARGARTRALRLERRRTRIALARRGALDRHPGDGRRRSPGPQRNYRAMGLDKFGPAIWQPFAAPALDARNSTGARVTLDEFKGRNVILVFYLGTGCAHCVSQIKDLSERSDKWKGLDTDVLAVSADSVTANARLAGLAERAAARRRPVPQRAALQVVRRFRGDADSLHGAHRQDRPRPLGTPWRRAVHRLRLPRLAAGADERARGEDSIVFCVTGVAPLTAQSGFNDQSVVGMSSETVGWMCTARLMSV